MELKAGKAQESKGEPAVDTQGRTVAPVILGSACSGWRDDSALKVARAERWVGECPLPWVQTGWGRPVPRASKAMTWEALKVGSARVPRADPVRVMKDDSVRVLRAGSEVLRDDSARVRAGLPAGGARAHFWRAVFGQHRKGDLRPDRRRWRLECRPRRAKQTWPQEWRAVTVYCSVDFRACPIPPGRTPLCAEKDTRRGKFFRL